MRITDLEITNFRSIRHLEMHGLGDFVVLYGRNGGGKTNILRAAELAFRLLAADVRAGCPDRTLWPNELVGLSTGDHLRRGTQDLRVTVTADLEGETTARVHEAVQLQALRLSVKVTSAGASVHAEALAVGGRQWKDLRKAFHSPPRDPALHFTGHHTPESPTGAPEFQTALRLLLERVGDFGYLRADDVRSLRTTAGPLAAGSARQQVLALLAQSRVEEAVARAATSDDDSLRERFHLLRRVLTAAPLSLPDLEAVVPDGQYRLRLRRPGVTGTLPADAGSLGEQQVIFLLGTLLFSGADVCAVEEPEAHLHAPTLGRALREVLRKLVHPEDGSAPPVRQLFVATHSNLFDLDPEGFWAVSAPGGETVAVRETRLSRIDEEHLFEPGPAKRILEDMLRNDDPDRVVAHGAKGPITAAQMLRELQEDTEEAVRYAQALSRAAARRFLDTPAQLRPGT